MGWISIDKRLPKKLEEVLFHWMLVDSFGTPCVRNVSMGYMCDEGWNIYLPYHSFKMCPDKLKVTHWMELPEYPSTAVCSHENIDMESRYQCEDCKQYVRMWFYRISSPNWQ